MNTFPAGYSPGKVLVAFLLCLTTAAATLTGIPASAAVSGGGGERVVVSAQSDTRAVSAAALAGGRFVGAIEAGDNLYTLEAPDGQSAGDFVEALTELEQIDWAVPASTTVHANPFYAWAEPDPASDGSESQIQANPFYAWAEPDPASDGSESQIQANPFYAWDDGGADPDAEPGANPVHRWSDPRFAHDNGYDVRTYLGVHGVAAVADGDGVRVAVIDTGFDVTHPMLASNMVPGADFVDGDTDVTDEPNHLDDDGDGLVDEAAGHGTHVAGVVAQIAPGADIIPIRALDADGVGTVYAVVAAVEFALAQNADIINLSFGTDDPSPALEAALGRAARAGVVVVAAAGNANREGAQIPANYASVLSVAAFDPARGTVASFGNWGESVDVAALGVDVRSANGTSGSRSMSGSSVASPVVAGQAALLLAANATWDRVDILRHVQDTADARANDPRPTRHGEVQVGPSVASVAFAATASGPEGFGATERTGPWVHDQQPMASFDSGAPWSARSGSAANWAAADRQCEFNRACS